jgi:glycosyltransferase involved in cell wall biosynthesis
MSTGEMDLHVLFASNAGASSYFDAGFGQEVRFQDDLLEGFSYEFLPGHLTSNELSGRISNARVGERLSAFGPDVVQVYGYYHPLSRGAIQWARAAGKPVLMCSDSELRAPRKWWEKAMKAAVLPRIFRQCDGFLTVGDCNEAYYRNYGVSSNRFFRCPYPIDDRKLTEAIAKRGAARSYLTEKSALPADATVALVVGKLTTRKAVDHAIKAMARVWADGLRGQVFLVAAGNGPEREALESLAKSLEPEAVRFAGFVEVMELPRYYCGADLLVHPSSQDPHPLAVAEAVFCGLPVIVSDRVGSVGPSDDVRPGFNGLEYPYGDVEALARHVAFIHRHPEARQGMSLHSLQIGQQRTLSASVTGYLNALSAVFPAARADFANSL